MILQQIGIELRKTYKHPAFWLGLSGLTLLLAGFIVIEHLQIANGYRLAQGGLERDLLSGLAFWGWIGVLAFAVSAAVVFAYDYSDRSINLWLTHGINRRSLFISRVVTVLFFGLFLAGFVTVAILLLGTVSRLIFFGQVDASQLNWHALTRLVLRTFWVSLPYLGLGGLLGVFFRSPLLAAGGTIIYGAVLERLLGGLADRFPVLIRYFPAQLGMILQEMNLELSLKSEVITPAMPETRAVLMIGLIFICLCAVTQMRFSSQDIGG